MLQDEQIKTIKEYRNKGLSYNKIAKKMDISVKTVMKYGKEEEAPEEQENPEAKDPIGENSVIEEHVQKTTTPSTTYPQRFRFIESIISCEKAIEHLKNKDYGQYSSPVRIFIAKYEYVLVLLRKYNNEGIEALAELNKELEKYDTEYNTICSLKEDITRLRREKTKQIEENKAQEEEFKDNVVERRRMFMAYDSKIAEKQARLENLKAEVSLLEEEKAAGERAMANIIEEGKTQALYYEKQIKDIRQHYNLTVDFAEMVELKPKLESTITQLTEHLRDMNDTINLQENREILRKPLENLIEVIDVLPSDLFRELYIAVEKRKATEPAFVQQEMVQRMQSNQPFSHDDMLKTMMTGMAKAINGEDEFDQIMKMKKLQQMMQQ